MKIEVSPPILEPTPQSQLGDEPGLAPCLALIEGKWRITQKVPIQAGGPYTVHILDQNSWQEFEDVKACPVKPIPPGTTITFTF